MFHYCRLEALRLSASAQGALLELRSTIQMVRSFEIRFCAVEDILENTWQLSLIPGYTGKCLRWRPSTPLRHQEGNFAEPVELGDPINPYALLAGKSEFLPSSARARRGLLRRSA